jgi:hypothetical protein
MKKSLLILSLFIGSIGVIEAQCTIVNSCTPTSGFCTTPTSGSSLPGATETVSYSTTIQVSIATTISTATIDSAKVSAVSGLPTGLTWSTNPANGVINGGTDGCILISGTPASGSAGNYTIAATMTIYTSIGLVHPNLHWSLNVTAMTGVASIPVTPGFLLISPNPASSQISIAADFHFQKANIYDSMGGLVLSLDANNTNKTSIDLGKLTSGIYFIQVADGTRSVMRKFIKD